MRKSKIFMSVCAVVIALVYFCYQDITQVLNDWGWIGSPTEVVAEQESVDVAALQDKLQAALQEVLGNQGKVDVPVMPGKCLNCGNPNCAAAQLTNVLQNVLQDQQYGEFLTNLITSEPATYHNIERNRLSDEQFLAVTKAYYSVGGKKIHSAIKFSEFKAQMMQYFLNQGTVKAIQTHFSVDKKTVVDGLLEVCFSVAKEKGINYKDAVVANLVEDRNTLFMVIPALSVELSTEDKTTVSDWLCTGTLDNVKRIDLMTNYDEFIRLNNASICAEDAYDDIVEIFVDKHGRFPKGTLMSLFNDINKFSELLKKSLDNKQFVFPRDMEISFLTDFGAYFVEQGGRHSHLRKMDYEQSVLNTSEQTKAFVVALLKAELINANMPVNEHVAFDKIASRLFLGSSVHGFFEASHEISTEALNSLVYSGLHKKKPADELVQLAKTSPLHMVVYEDVLHQHKRYEEVVKFWGQNGAPLFLLININNVSDEALTEFSDHAFKTRIKNVHYLPVEKLMLPKIQDHFINHGGRCEHMGNQVIPNTPEGVAFATRLVDASLKNRDMLLDDEQKKFLVNTYIVNNTIRFFRRTRDLSNDEIKKMIDVRMHPDKYKGQDIVVVIHGYESYTQYAFSRNFLDDFAKNKKNLNIVYGQCDTKESYVNFLKSLQRDFAEQVVGFSFGVHGCWNGLSFKDDALRTVDTVWLDKVSELKAKLYNKSVPGFFILIACQADGIGDKKSPAIADLLRQSLERAIEHKSGVQFLASKYVTATSPNLKFNWRGHDDYSAELFLQVYTGLEATTSSIIK